MFFFFSSRRRHTRSLRDWSSDVCSSDLWGLLFCFACLGGLSHLLLDYTNNYGVRPFSPFYPRWYSWDIVFIVERSEERRVGKECRSRWGRGHSMRKSSVRDVANMCMLSC